VSPEARKITNLFRDTKSKTLDEKYWKKIDWTKVDVFALGVTLFSSIYFVSPFKEGNSSKNDPYYKYIFRKNKDKFWSSNIQVLEITSQIEEKNQKTIQHAQDLISHMIAYDPQDRYSVA
jgi:serine/threonine protein kinase